MPRWRIRDLIDLGPVGAPERKLQITAQQIAVDKADGFALLLQGGTLEAPAIVLAGALVDSSGIRV